MTNNGKSDVERTGIRNVKSIRIYHNPECSKSRAALALLEENDVDPQIIYYMETPPSIDEIKSLLAKLDLKLLDIIRRSEDDFDELGLDDETLSEEIILDLLQKHPQLLQRPIVVKGDNAIIARPPEDGLTLIGDD
ncbi:arsenate reductase (glutaredoxin) [Gammaproteobacteria bacterium]|nr:arsenate reductase (glutaredoxin) [Gammaproteobacteria bacterium]